MHRFCLLTNMPSIAKPERRTRGGVWFFFLPFTIQADLKWLTQKSHFYLEESEEIDGSTSLVNHLRSA